MLRMLLVKLGTKKEPMKTQYHVGLLVQRGRAVFQFRRCVDFLDCEIMEYLGVREQTKAAAKGQLRRNYGRILSGLQSRYPDKAIGFVTVD